MSDVIWFKCIVGMFDGTSFKKIKKATIAGESFRDKLTAVWVELLDLAAKCNRDGLLVDEKGVAMTINDIADQLDRGIDEMTACMGFYINNYMVEKIVDTMAITNWEKYQQTDGLERIREQGRERQQRFRENKKILLEARNVTDNVTVTQTSFDTKELNRLVKDIKEKIDTSGMYANNIHKPLMFEVIDALGEACLYEKPVKFSGEEVDADGFKTILQNLTIEQISRAVNAVLMHGESITNRKYYILAVVVTQSRRGK